MFKKIKNKKGPKNICIKRNYKIELSATSMSISMLLMSFLFFFFSKFLSHVNIQMMI